MTPNRAVYIVVVVEVDNIRYLKLPETIAFAESEYMVTGKSFVNFKTALVHLSTLCVFSCSHKTERCMRLELLCPLHSLLLKRSFWSVD